MFAKVSLNKSTGQKSLYAVNHFSSGDTICHFHAGTTLTIANRFTLQIGENKHITLLPEILQYTNHSCSPSAFFDTTSMVLISLRDIQPGDEITFFYPSTEWEMAEPFKCNCGSPECLKVIRGAASLEKKTLEKYMLTDFIREMILRKVSI